MTTQVTLEKLLGTLIVLTLIAIVAERPLLETGFTLDASSGQTALYDDSNEQGGSTSTIVDANAISWLCNIGPGHNFPHCGFELILDPERRQGLDLRHIDTIRLWLDYTGPTETLRFYLRNFDPVYSTLERNDTTKYNQVEFNAELARNPEGPIEFSIKDFFVANWWFQRFRIAPNLAHPQFDNIVVLEVQTGVRALPGEHHFTLQQVEFIGQRVTTERWYQMIVGVWLIAALLLLVVRVTTLKRELTIKNLRERELTEVNTLLDSRSRRLEEKAKTDPLTGAFNREGLEEAMQTGLTQWRHQGKPLSIVMLDLDHFKHINDTYGHATGDKVLSGVAALVHEHIRSSDSFARWGGEEFILLCRDTRLQEAANIAEKLRDLIAHADLGPEPVHASFGVATLRSGETLEQLFMRVDRALYAAKDHGRNRVEVSPAAT